MFIQQQIEKDFIIFVQLGISLQMEVTQQD
jgi:hypothetical protein